MAKVKVEQGWLEGEVIELVTKDGSYYCFKGIPYAAPPIGKLRFKAPEPPTNWEGVREAKKHGPICHQYDIFTSQILPGSEDCLYLNVYTQNLKPAKPLPVMVFIHGGGYKSGSGNDSQYGPDFLVQEDVILVTINYRLEALGFLCLDTVDVPGNAGLKDQVAALKWINKNIANFGGDSNNVTVFGESAGGASAAFHILSPMSKGLFQRAIAMSGVPLCDWSKTFEPRKRAFILGQELGLRTNDAKQLLEYLQNVPVEKLVNVTPNIFASDTVMSNVTYFGPVIEKKFGHEAFLTVDPEEYLNKGNINDVELLIGNTSEEGAFAVTKIGEYFPAYDKFLETFLPQEILLMISPTKAIQLSQKIRDFYFGDKQINNDTMKCLIRFMSDSSFIYHVEKFKSLLAQVAKKSIYSYKFSCVSERNIFGNSGASYGIIGASHLDDLVYLFDPKFANLPIDKSSDSYKMIKLSCSLFANFAKYGNPTPNNSLGIEWPKYVADTKYSVDITNKLSIQCDPNKEIIQFWQSIYSEAQ